MAQQIEIRQLTTIKELYDMQKVEKAVWNMPPNPVHQTYTAMNHGGVLLGAFAGDDMVGFIYSFGGFHAGKPYLCSHMLGILPEYRKDGLGLMMKKKQAEIASKKGYTMMTWTYDPLESLNAYLNLHKIGAVGASYKENHYGDLKDGLNQGLPTDRIQVEWYFNQKSRETTPELTESRLLVKVDDRARPVVTEVSEQALESATIGGWFVAIPENFQAMKQENLELAKEWRLQTRSVFQKLYSNGYKAKDVIRRESEQISYYYFSK